jgi:ABC-type nitrate/sulfonate/bicarbonate transport system permease component
VSRPVSWIRAHVADIAIRLAALAALVGFWWWATARAQSLFFPTPDTVFQSVWNDWLMNFGESWRENFWPSLKRLLVGFGLAAVVSVAVGAAIGRSRKFGQYVEPIIHFVRAVPPPAFLPLFIILLGIEDIQKIVLISIGVFPPILLNTIEGVRSIDPQQFDTADVLQISRRRRITHVILPAAAPKIFAGLRISMSIAVILMVISELFAATNGLGFRILQSSRQFRYVELWAGIVVLGVVGTVLNGLLVLVERRVLRWSAV